MTFCNFSLPAVYKPRSDLPMLWRIREKFPRIASFMESLSFDKLVNVVNELSLDEPQLA